jgi:ABC-type protease/lipase transport system fused ATPase/permease subunit
MIGYLPQDVELLDGTIAENISRFQSVESSEILEAAQNAGVHDLITRLPGGYDSQLIDGGRNLSGGFRQRLGLARAVFGRPLILVLDEPNSHLDESGEAALRGTILKMKQLGSTVVVITHRASLLSVVDNILLIVDGRISKYGPRHEFVKPAPAVAAA